MQKLDARAKCKQKQDQFGKDACLLLVSHTEAYMPHGVSSLHLLPQNMLTSQL